MDLLDELQQELDINAGYHQLLEKALARIRFLESELEAAQSRAVYATWGQKSRKDVNVTRSN